jgi:leucyl aminopeptidase
MNIQIVSDAKKTKHDLIVLPFFQGQDIAGIYKKYFGGTLTSPLSSRDFKNKIGRTQLLYTAGDVPSRILLLGLGEQSKFSFAAWRLAVQTAMTALLGLNVENVLIVMPVVKASEATRYLELTAFALTFGAYQFDQYQHATPDEKKTVPNNFYILSKLKGRSANEALAAGQLIGNSANEARDLGNHPANIATPSHLAAHAIALSKKHKFFCRIMNREDIKKEGMGLILGIAQGSSEPAKFIILEYGDKKQPPVVLIGKGLTFDSGGVSIKPSDKMEEMKYDMAGGADVLAIFGAAAGLKLPLHLIGLVPAVENLPSGTASRPGDVLTAHNGQTVEIITTDAEGRMVLADAISFAKKHYNPKLILEYSTLTGAVVAALGNQLTGFFTNTPAVVKNFSDAAKLTDEKFWMLPLEDSYKDQLKSQFADMKNVGERGSAGAITAALFLQNFVGETPWVHFDIAGTAWTTQPKPHLAAGATAWGVYLTMEFLRNL